MNETVSKTLIQSVKIGSRYIQFFNEWIPKRFDTFSRMYLVILTCNCPFKSSATFQLPILLALNQAVQKKSSFGNLKLSISTGKLSIVTKYLPR